MKSTTTKTTTISASEFGRLTNRSRTRIGQLIRNGTLPHHEGRLVIAEAVPRFIEHLDALNKPSDGRDRIESARAGLLEHKLEVERGRYISEEEVRLDITRGFGQLKSQLLVLPNRLGQVLALETDPITVEEKIRAEIFAVLDLMSRDRWAAKTS